MYFEIKHMLTEVGIVHLIFYSPAWSIKWLSKPPRWVNFWPHRWQENWYLQSLFSGSIHIITILTPRKPCFSCCVTKKSFTLYTDDDHHEPDICVRWYPSCMQSSWWWQSSVYGAVIILMMIMIIRVRCSHDDDASMYNASVFDAPV